MSVRVKDMVIGTLVRLCNLTVKLRGMRTLVHSLSRARAYVVGV